MELTEQAYSAYILLKRAGFLMEDYPEDTADAKIKKICQEIAEHLGDNDGMYDVPEQEWHN